jgi:hypothetical protein
LKQTRLEHKYLNPKGKRHKLVRNRNNQVHLQIAIATDTKKTLIKLCIAIDSTFKRKQKNKPQKWTIETPNEEPLIALQVLFLKQNKKKTTCAQKN